MIPSSQNDYRADYVNWFDGSSWWYSTRKEAEIIRENPIWKSWGRGPTCPPPPMLRYLRYFRAMRQEEGFWFVIWRDFQTYELRFDGKGKPYLQEFHGPLIPGF